MPTIRIFFETSPEMSKSEELGRVVKGFATCEVNVMEVIIHNAPELFEFLLEKLTIKDSPDDKKALLNRVFCFIPSCEIDDYCRQLPVLKYKSVKGTRSIHQVFNDTSNEKGLYHHQFACICENCLMQKFDEYFYLKEMLTTFSCCQHLIKAKWDSFVAKPENSTSDSEDSEDDSDDEVYYPETGIIFGLKG